MDATAFQNFMADAGATLESLFPATLTLAGTGYACARGPWRNNPGFDAQGEQPAELRECSVRIRKSLISATAIQPGVTSCALDGTVCVITAISAGASDPAFHITLQAAAPALAQE